ncbi:MAG TPA: SpoIIE family protein phosphatase [Solirubrobacteraceae bacterium]|nr:SpoIIE family protein phosphatase [Solirubrobacteraceae bacterium]
MQRILRLPARIALVVGAGAVLVALGVTLLLVNTVKLHRSADATGRSDEYLVAVTNLERIVVDAETGLRGYVITGRSLFLEPTHDAQQGYAKAKTALSRAAATDGAFPREVKALESAADAYMTGYLPTTLSLAARDRPASRGYTITLQGKRLVDGVRARTATLERLVSGRERGRQDSAKTESSHSTVEAILVLILLTGGTLLLGVFLGYLVLSRERARQRSERTVEVLRQSLLPTSLPAIPGCDLAARFHPAQAAELVGGDFYDAFAVSDGRWAIIVGDVCGKGAEAAAVTAMARWTLRSLASWSVGPDEALRFLNRAMLGEDLGGRFITVAYLLLTIEDGTARVSVACAGHPSPILVPSAGDPRLLPSRGTLLGIWPDIRLQTTELALEHGDTILLYTDGVSDPGPGPERQPTDALRDHARGAGADQLAETLERYATVPRAPQRDDIAIVAVQFTDHRPAQVRPDRTAESRAGESSSHPAKNPPTTWSR